jgi:hypothetical protein
MGERSRSRKVAIEIRIGAEQRFENWGRHWVIDWFMEMGWIEWES